jgi:nucleoside permease NupC
LRLLANIIGMLIAFVALVFLVDKSLGLLPTGGEPLTLIGSFGWVFAPLAWLTGIPWEEAHAAGELLATKLFINELVAYLQLAAVEPRYDRHVPGAHCGYSAPGAPLHLVRSARHLYDRDRRRADHLRGSP